MTVPVFDYTDRGFSFFIYTMGPAKVYVGFFPLPEILSLAYSRQVLDNRAVPVATAPLST